MPKFDKTYTYALELVTSKDSVKAILNDRASKKDEAGIVEYIGSAMFNVESKIDAAKQQVKDYNDAIKAEEMRLEYIKEQVAEWMEESGVDKLEGGLGDKVSSLTYFTPTPTQKEKIEDEAKIDKKFFVTKTTLDKTAVKQALQNGEEVEGATLEVTHVANKIKINKKRG